MTMSFEGNQHSQEISNAVIEQMSLSKWVHPRTGDVRVYVHGLGASVYVVDAGIADDCAAGLPQVVVNTKGPSNPATDVDAFAAAIAEFVKQNCPSDLNPTWADYLSLAH